MRVSQGGTYLWCPNCKKVTVCAAKNPSYIASSSGQRWVQLGHPDVNWFRRGRECQTCRNSFLTAELEEDFVDELVKLRNALRDLKAHADAYSAQASAASKSLQDLTDSLGILNRLKLWRDA